MTNQYLYHITGQAPLRERHLKFILVFRHTSPPTALLSIKPRSGYLIDERRNISIKFFPFPTWRERWRRTNIKWSQLFSCLRSKSLRNHLLARMMMMSFVKLVFIISNLSLTYTFSSFLSYIKDFYYWNQLLKIKSFSKWTVFLKLILIEKICKLDLLNIQKFTFFSSLLVNE